MALRAAFNGALPRLPLAGRSMSSSSDEVLFEVRNKVGIMTMNRTKQLNALSLNMVQMMYPKLKEWESKVEMVIIRGRSIYLYILFFWTYGPF